MKKILLSIAAVAAITGVNAQIYSANDAAGFATWTFYDLDGDTYNFAAGDLTGAGTVLDAQGPCLISNSWVSAGGGTPLTPNNIAVSPVIDCSAAVGVTVVVKAGNVETTASGWFEEHYAIYVVNGAQLAAAITGTFPTAAYEGTLAAGEVMETQTLNVTSSAAGQSSVYIILRHFNCTDENFILFDDIVVTGQFASVDENSLTASAYPNPTTDVLNLSFNSQVQVVNIYALNGEIISTIEVNALTSTFDVSTLAPGVYFYEAVTSEGTRARNTFVKQ